MTPWDLNAVVLCHTQRWFAAVTAVVQAWRDPGDRELAELTTLLGNAMWAHSGFVAESREHEHAMAWTGAMAGTLGGKLADLSRDRREGALALVSAQERALRELDDQLLTVLLAELGDRQLTPGQLNRWVWQRLFPHDPYASSTAELQGAIQRRLTAALS